MNWEWDISEAQLKYCFGSCQTKKIFPFHYPPNRLGNAYVPLRGAPHRGPGCYNSHERNCVQFNLINTPMSNKGYIIGSRTSQRFKTSRKDAKLSPLKKETQKMKPSCVLPPYAPFNTISSRFNERPSDSSYFPGPGTYYPKMQQCRKVTWPMKFGSPDWAQVPSLKKRTLKTELITDREFKLHRNRVAYLSLYYS
ncbi:ciliary microtubule-associated protein 3 [Macrotis lagotis]|uniref:ciliary microtubule-associated protein 3 n=1 Tax=Macrotis lagotis TaxID=92651 RepID=UPI003D692475